MIKILVTGMSTNLGGINTYLYHLYKNSDRSKFQFDFINSQGAKFALQDELEKDNVNILTITPRYINYKKHKEDLKNIFLNNDYDFIHINIMGFSWFDPIVLAYKYSKAKIILHSHNGNKEFLQDSGMKSIVLDKIGRFKTRNIPYLRVACGKQAGKYMFSGRDFTVFNNGIDINKFEFNENHRKEIRNELNINQDTTIIGQIAKLEGQKNPLFLIDIFNEYHHLNNNSKLIIVGEGSLKNQIENKIKMYKMENDVLLLGKRTDAYKIYNAFDMFVMPSIAEGLSISLIEAQVNGLKCFTYTKVDETSNITGNVKFISLKDGYKKWAELIYSNDNNRDIEVVKKIPKEFNNKKSYERVYDYYIKYLRR